MPAIQTTYQQYHAVAYPGMLATQEKNNIVSRTVQDTTLGIGVAVFQGAADLSVTATPGTNFVGITVESLVAAAGSGGIYAQGGSAKVLTDKTIWVSVAQAVTAGAAVTVDSVAGTFGVSTGTGRTALPRAVYDTSAAAGGLAIVRLVGG